MAAAVDVVRGGERLRGALSPLRRRLLTELREPASAAVLAARLGQSRQRLNYHVRELEKAGLVELVELRPRRGCVERVVRATARAVMVDPDASGDLQTATQDRFAADALLAVAARTISDVATMRARADAKGRRLVTFAIEAEVGFAHPADIRRFAERLGRQVTELVATFDSGRPEHRYRLVAGGHPAPGPQEEP
ncbi:MAG TPA: helix-turn-helix domain-containing protein [Actinomycetes bacterium]|nr:helix-turn-helix domain-containing protein [Actinomycetes bacterium]